MDMSTFYVSMKQLQKEFNLEGVYEPEDIERRQVHCTDVNRPGLPIVGFFDYFERERLQILGRVEYTYLEGKTAEERIQIFDRLLSFKEPAVIVTRELPVFPELIEAARKYEVPIYRTKNSTSRFMAAVISYLSVELAPRITRHGVLVEVYGEGVLILGESGVGKSETAVELVKRGHRLVADDAVEIKRVSDKSLVGSSPEIIRHFIELRGIGIIDVRRIFGMGAVKPTEKIDMVIALEAWNEKKHYDRLGLVTEYTDILGIQIPSLTIPVRPGRNLAVVVEVAAMNNRQKKMGFNPAQELNDRLMEKMSAEEQL
ncbi:HPr(Ser) kinase/phosphatase [Acetivibrio sp. MSJd-27]|jgi:HPr(ser) kinase/phosphatase|uniref:HPr(Ser) kinase/phosphatase n=1 Tax=Acetivibrio sp. MSJd-27 TaxID=2841523 RepID=UPI0015A7C200|nr:HPr(Ser) kinase/phosphatase [Acetivibrio sp. MSJd-27]MBU5450106.1 HPr(Ser) kinase/phosphatase [Acetivibrio sp. MSJd-27]